MFTISIYFYCLLLFVIHESLFDKLRDLLIYLSLSAMRCISAEILDLSQTVGVLIGKWLPNLATMDNTASYVDLAEMGIFHKI